MERCGQSLLSVSDVKISFTQVHIELDETLSRDLYDHLNKNNLPAEGITCFAKYDAPLRWGEGNINSHSH